MKNTLYYGDNLDIMRRYVADESVDLIYLDPPFNSARKYNLLFKEASGKVADAHIKVFEDTWHWNEATEEAFRSFVTSGYDQRLIGQVTNLVEVLDRNDATAYIVMMAPRLAELYRVLKPTGSLYLHCDPTMSHYLKLLLDVIFGVENFRNEIIWKRTSAHSDTKRFSHVTDTIFFYSKSNYFTWNPQFEAHDESYLRAKYGNTDPDGRRYYLGDMNSPNPRHNLMYEWKGFPSPVFGWRFSKETMAKLDAEGRIYYPKDKTKRPRIKRYLDEMDGEIIDNLWIDIPPINSQARERLGYPTQKPLKLLERIIECSSNEGDVVFDPFCGCGTATDAAQALSRRWIGIDITHLAIALIRWRLETRFGPRLEYEVRGEPVDVSGATALALMDRYQFQWWAVSRVGMYPLDDKKKKGADGGVDGMVRFVEDKGTTGKVIVQVKSGHVGVKDIKELRTTITNAGADIGVFVTLEEPTKPMRVEAAIAGKYKSETWQAEFPVIQILTIAELLGGKRPNHPPSGAPYKASEPFRPRREQTSLLDLKRSANAPTLTLDPALRAALSEDALPSEGEVDITDGD